MKTLILIALTVSIALAARFTGPVQVTEAGDSAVIAFTLDASADVEVGIIDKNGKIIRHLAAGVLNGTLPAPEPLSAGLSQRLVWDGLDDYGRISTNHPFTVRVRLAVLPEFERSISTRVFPANRAYGPGNIDPQTTYLSRQHHQFILDSTLYEEENPLDFTVSDETDEVFVKLTAPSAGNTSSWADLARFNGLTGANNGMLTGFVAPAGICYYPLWGEPRVSWDGRHIFYTEGSFSATYCAAGALIGNLVRYSINGGLAPWPATGAANVSGFYNGDQHSRGVGMGPDGSVYMIHYQDATNCPNCTLVTLPGGAATGYTSPVTVSRIKDGRVIEPKKVVIYGSLGCVRVDLKGNIYVGARIKPLGKPVPDFVNLDSLSGTINTLYSQAYWAEEMYGSVVKFDSTGGEITVFDTSGRLLSQTTNPGDFEGGSGRTLTATAMRAQDKVRVKGGFVWAHYGMSHILTHTSWRSKCWCNVTRFDVDRWGRIYYPNTFMHEICGIDNNRNALFNLKNRDIPEVAIGLGHEIEVTDKRLYVADWFNNQIAVFRWKAEVETSVTLATASADLLPGGSGRGFAVTPNPFHPSTRISFNLGGRMAASLRVMDAAGRTVRTLRRDVLDAGRHEAVWNGTDDAGKPAAAGLYTFVLQAGSRRMVSRGLLAR